MRLLVRALQLGLAVAAWGCAHPTQQASPSVPRTAPFPFDRGQAMVLLNAVGARAGGCFNLPPLAEWVHVRVEFEGSGAIARVTPSPEFDGTPAGNCVVALFHGARIDPFRGGPVTVGKSFRHLPDRGDPRDPPFDPAIVKRAAGRVPLDDCARFAGARRGQARLDLAPKGLRAVRIVGDVAATPLGGCVAGALYRGLGIPFFYGDPRELFVDFEVPEASSMQ
jgi:hypothetical protein